MLLWRTRCLSALFLVLLVHLVCGFAGFARIVVHAFYGFVQLVCAIVHLLGACLQIADARFQSFREWRTLTVACVRAAVCFHKDR